MKAIVQRQYGGAETLTVDEVPRPLTPAAATSTALPPDRVLIQVMATSLNAPDWRLLRGEPFITRFFYGLQRPKDLIRGTDLSGVIVAVGSAVKHLKAGDNVMADLSTQGFGAWAEYASVKQELVAKKPHNLSHLEAAALPLTAVTALQAVRDKARVQAGERVLIVGAAGGVGSYALQHAKVLGAHVTAVTSAKNAQQCLSLGADAILDYTKTPLSSIANSLAPSSQQTFDVIIAINGFNPLAVYRRLLKPQGRFVMVGGSNLNQVMVVSLFGSLLTKKGGQSFSGLLAKPCATDLDHIRTLVESGKLKPVIEREIPFEDIPKWIAELEKGHVSGKIVASLIESNPV